MLKYWDTEKNINFPFEIHGISMVLNVPILKHLVSAGMVNNVDPYQTALADMDLQCLF